MLVPIFIHRQPSGYAALAPDLPACLVEDTDQGRAFARLRLVIEGAIADLMISGQPIPAPRPTADWASDPHYRHGHWYEVHINLAHIEAVARHQRGRGPR